MEDLAAWRMKLVKDGRASCVLEGSGREGVSVVRSVNNVQFALCGSQRGDIWIGER